MKKYIIGLVVLSLFIIPSLSLAQISDVDPNPTASDCVSLQSPGLRYRSRDANTNGEVSLLQDFLQTKGYLNSEPTGYFGILTLKAVKDFQKDSGITSTGYVGAITKAKISSLTGCDGTIIITTPISKSNPVISGVSGPQSLKVGEQGTWTVNASDNSNPGSSGNLTYSVNWGDLSVVCPSGTSCATAQSSQQSATFTHTYNTAGTYTPTFTVTNSSGQSAKTSLSVKVGDITVSINHNPILNPIVFTTDMNVGKSYNFNFSATDPDNDNLCWTISWGDRTRGSMVCSTSNLQQKQGWVYNPSHAWDTAGKYTVSVTVSDNKGGSASSNLNINIIGSTPVTFLGDVNGDGLVTCDDSNMILKSVTGFITFTTEQKKRADMDGNGVVQSYDSALLMQKYSLSCSTTS